MSFSTRPEGDSSVPELFILYYGGKPYKYRYGEPFEATRLLVDGGYDTPEEAQEAYLKEMFQKQEEVVT